jgi:hypothetical protein
MKTAPAQPKSPPAKPADFHAEFYIVDAAAPGGIRPVTEEDREAIRAGAHTKRRIDKAA